MRCVGAPGNDRQKGRLGLIVHCFSEFGDRQGKGEERETLRERRRGGTMLTVFRKKGR